MTVDKDLLLILKSNGIGDGEPDLGEALMGSFLCMLLESGRLPARILCLNSGIFLATEGSPAKEQLDRFAENGTEVSSCGTCLDYYGRREKLIVGTVGNMRDTVQAMLTYGRVLTP